MATAIINPTEHVKIGLKRMDQATIHVSDNDKIRDLLEKTQVYLRDNFTDDFVDSMVDEQSADKIRYHIADYVRENGANLASDIEAVIKKIQTEIVDLGVIQGILNDPEITSIELVSPKETIVEKNGQKKFLEEVRFQDVDHMKRTIEKMLAPMGKTLNASEPVIDSAYNGFRICATLDVKSGGVSLDTPIVSIRKFPIKVYSDQDCIKYGNMSPEIVECFNVLYPCNPRVLISGGTNSGKTSQLIRIPLYLDPLTGLLSIEDSPEMFLKRKEQYKFYRNIKQFITKEHENERRRWPIWKLLKLSLRQNPDWIFIGEVRDEESAIEMNRAANTGHSVAATTHANSAADGATRIVQLNGNTRVAAAQVSKNLDLLIHQEDDHGVRRIVEIAELMGYDGVDEPILNTIFRYNFETGQHERVGNIKKLKDKLIKYRQPKEVIAKWVGEE